MLTIGIDIGSVGTKAVLWNGSSFQFCMRPTGWDLKKTSESVLLELMNSCQVTSSDIAKTVATGYGRKMCDGAYSAVTEITCHAAGAAFMIKGVQTVLDIGGQDSKVITLDCNGNVTDFLMNDKCAAGTGRFINNMAVLLDYTLEDFSNIPEKTDIQAVTSMCTVFAESEVISLLSRGIPKENIALGVLDSIALRAAGMITSLSRSGPVAFTGGSAKNKLLAAMISKHLKRPVLSFDESQFAGAIGAALIAAK